MTTVSPLCHSPEAAPAPRRGHLPRAHPLSAPRDYADPACCEQIPPDLPHLKSIPEYSSAVSATAGWSGVVWSGVVWCGVALTLILMPIRWQLPSVWGWHHYLPRVAGQRHRRLADGERLKIH